MAAGPKSDVHPALPEKVERAHNVVAGLDLMIDVLDAGTVGWKHRNRMMHLVDAQERCVANAVADARVADLRPEGLVASGISRAQADVTETGDAGIARAVVAGAADGGAPSDLDAVAGGIGEANELAHHAHIGLFACADMHVVAKLLQFDRRLVEIVLVRDLETSDLNPRIAVEVAQRVLALVGLEVTGVPSPRTDLQPKDACCEPRRSLEIARTEPHVADLLQLDHERAPANSPVASASNSGISLRLPQPQNDCARRGNCRGR